MTFGGVPVTFSGPRPFSAVCALWLCAPGAWGPLRFAPGFGGRWPPRRAWAASLPPPPSCAPALPFGTPLRVGRTPAGGRGPPPGCFLGSAPRGPARSARRKASAMRLAPLAGAPGVLARSFPDFWHDVPTKGGDLDAKRYHDRVFTAVFRGGTRSNPGLYGWGDAEAHVPGAASAGPETGRPAGRIGRPDGRIPAAYMRGPASQGDGGAVPGVRPGARAEPVRLYLFRPGAGVSAFDKVERMFYTGGAFALVEREVGPDRLVRPLRLRLVLLRTVFPHFGLSVWRDGQGRGGPRPCFLRMVCGIATSIT